MREWSPHTMCHMSCVTCHVSHVKCHMSPVTCHLSHVKKSCAKKIGQSGEASRCYQQGLPRLVLERQPNVPGDSTHI